MASKAHYRFSRSKYEYIAFDSKGYIVEAKGFDHLIWILSHDTDKELIGKHVDELADLLKKNGINCNVYLDFEAHVHVPLLKSMLKNVND